MYTLCMTVSMLDFFPKSYENDYYDQCILPRLLGPGVDQGFVGLILDLRTNNCLFTKVVLAEK